MFLIFFFTIGLFLFDRFTQRITHLEYEACNIGKKSSMQKITGVYLGIPNKPNENW